MTQLQIKIVVCIFAAGLGVCGYLLTQVFPNRAEIMNLELRLTGVEKDLAHSPSEDEVNGLKVLLGRVDERLANIERTLRRLDEGHK